MHISVTLKWEWFLSNDENRALLDLTTFLDRMRSSPTGKADKGGYGGDYFLPDLSNPAIQTVMAAMGAIILLPLGIYFLVRAVKEPLRAYESARHHWNEGTVPGHLIAEVANAAALNIFNPVTIAYWICVTPNWLPLAHSVLGYSARVWES